MKREQFYAAFSETRTTFLRSYCPQCHTGKMLRCHAEGRATLDDNGSEAVVSKIYDRCDSCGHITNESGIAPWPLSNINMLFLRFEIGVLPRADFDAEITALLRKSNATGA